MRELKLTPKEHEVFLRLVEKRLNELDMSVDDLAVALDVSKQSIYNYRTDRSRTPSKYLGGKIATYLDISLGDIRRG